MYHGSVPRSGLAAGFTPLSREYAHVRARSLYQSMPLMVKKCGETAGERKRRLCAVGDMGQAWPRCRSSGEGRNEAKLAPCYPGDSMKRTVLGWQPVPTTRAQCALDPGAQIGSRIILPPQELERPPPHPASPHRPFVAAAQLMRRWLQYAAGLGDGDKLANGPSLSQGWGVAVSAGFLHISLPQRGAGSLLQATH